MYTSTLTRDSPEEPIERGAAAFERVCAAASLELARHRDALSSATGVDPHWWIARSLDLAFTPLMRQAEAEAVSALETEPDPVARNQCRRALDDLKRMQLDLAALAIDPETDAAFVTRFHQFHQAWEEWVEVTRALLSRAREEPPE